jgi:hypothetical protein
MTSSLEPQSTTPRQLVPGSYAEPHFAAVIVNERGSAVDFDLDASAPAIADLSLAELAELAREWELTTYEYLSARQRALDAIDARRAALTMDALPLAVAA